MEDAGAHGAKMGRGTAWLGASLERQERLRRDLLSRHPSDDVQLTAGQSPCLVEADPRHFAQSLDDVRALDDW